MLFLKRMKNWFVKVAVITLLGMAVISCVEPPGSGVNIAEEEIIWDLQLSGFFRNGEHPLCIHVKERENRWIAAVGNSRIPGTSKHSYNECSYWIDMSGIFVKDDTFRGPATVHLTPDLWGYNGPRDLTVSLYLQAVVSANGSLEGKYAVTNINDDDKRVAETGEGGIISGISGSYRPEALEEVTYTLRMQNSLIGAVPDYKERCMVLLLGFEGKKLTSSMFGSLSLKREIFGLNGFNEDARAMVFDGDTIRGKITVPTSTLDLVPCEYTFDFNGAVVEDILAGTYKMTTKIEGGDVITLTGCFDGYRSAGIQYAVDLDTRPWWVPAEGFQPLQPGEHPRLLFRKSDLPALREKAETPEGKAMVSRLRYLLNGSDGETMPLRYSNADEAYDKDAERNLPAGTYTISHAAGYGLLYQLTGNRKYAEFGRQCFELALQGQRDRDDRYSWIESGGPLRSGPTLGWYALGYDLCYDGWDKDTREKYGRALVDYTYVKNNKTNQNNLSLESLVRGTMPPGSNHYGMQVGGAAMVLMAVTGEPWVDQERISMLLKISEKSMIRNVTEGFGDGGFFAEGDGTGSMSSHIIYLTAIQAWKNTMGMDFVNVDRPNVRMTALKWIYLTIIREGKPDFWPIRGAYGQNVWAGGLSGAGYFGIGIGAVTEEQQAAMKWYYDRFLLEHHMKAGTPYEAKSFYPHHMVSALVNWPVDMPGKNPAEVLPLCYRDSKYSFYAWRNRWQDENDIVISVLTKPTRGYMGARPDSALQVMAFGEKFSWGNVVGDVKHWQTSPHGETSVLRLSDGTSVAVDFTGASGAEGMLVTTGQAEGIKANLGEATLTIKFLTAGPEPALTVTDDRVVAGKQAVSLKDGNIVFAVTGSD